MKGANGKKVQRTRARKNKAQDGTEEYKKCHIQYFIQ